MKYQELSSKPDFSEIQPKVIEFWKENKVFEESLKTGKKGEVVFYDGPPFPTGKPHHGTVLVSFIKDMIARYWTMRGFQVPRVWGWDCHGLPIENQAENILSLNSISPDTEIIQGQMSLNPSENRILCHKNQVPFPQLYCGRKKKEVLLE